MTVEAKCMPNGYPVGAVVGSREVMAPAKDMFISSSYWSDNVGLAASLTTIRELKRRNSTERFKEIGLALMSALEEAIASVGVSARVEGLYTGPSIEIDVPEESLQRKVNTLFVQEMALRGIHAGHSFKATLAHSERDIQQTAEAAEESLRVVMQGLEGDLDRLLLTEPTQEPFRRLVRYGVGVQGSVVG